MPGALPNPTNYISCTGVFQLLNFVGKYQGLVIFLLWILLQYGCVTLFFLPLLSAALKVLFQIEFKNI